MEIYLYAITGTLPSRGEGNWKIKLVIRRML